MPLCVPEVLDAGAEPRIAAMASDDDEMVNQVGLSRKHLLDTAERSVKRWGMYIDVFQVH